MKRNLRALGLTLVAAFAMSALVASAAQAIKVTTGVSPAVITGTSVGKQKFTFNPNTPAAKAVFECTTVGGYATVNSGAEEVTFTNISVSGCTATIGATTAFMTVDMEGCDYKFHSGVNDVANHWKEGEVNLTCPVGVTGPVITVFSDAAHTTRICKYTIWNFANKKEITYTNTAGTPDDVDMKTNLSFSITRNEGVLCPKPDESALYESETTLKAYEDLGGNPPTEGNQVGLTIS